MYAGHIVEYGTADEIFYNPCHEYTKGLIRSIPKLNVEQTERLIPIEGQPVDLLNPPAGCPFAPRCRACMKVCLDPDALPRRNCPKHITATVGCCRNKPWRKERLSVSEQKKLVEVQHLQQYFPVKGGRHKQFVQAVDDVSFYIYRGETLGLVGESGCRQNHRRAHAFALI